MANNSNSKQVPTSAGLIELINPPEITLTEPKTLIDFGVVGEMLNKYEARNKEYFLSISLVFLRYNSINMASS